MNDTINKDVLKKWKLSPLINPITKKKSNLMVQLLKNLKNYMKNIIINLMIFLYLIIILIIEKIK